MKKKNTLDFNTVHECNRCLDCKTLHPQVSLINLENPCLEQNTVKFEFYAILLIEDCPDECSCCGRKYYDYSNATMVFLKPGEVFRMNEQGKAEAYQPANAENQGAVQEAIDSCPVSAIAWED